LTGQIDAKANHPAPADIPQDQQALLLLTLG